ncbi:MAG: hypothetical protein DWI24_09010 [Planctomycetota bacterium]|nr:MAG: hypothetical protein DWI24_09010 [Planctomycetota bacterium]
MNRLSNVRSIIEILPAASAASLYDCQYRKPWHGKRALNRICTHHPVSLYDRLVVKSNIICFLRIGIRFKPIYSKPKNPLHFLIPKATKGLWTSRSIYS